MARKKKKKEKNGYGEPWNMYSPGEEEGTAIFGVELKDKDGKYLGTVLPKYAKRIQLCINACRHLTNEQLEAVEAAQNTYEEDKYDG